MSLFQVLYFLIAAIVMGGVGTLMLLRPVLSQKTEQVYTWLMLAFAAKLLLGVGFLLIAWKIFEWSTRVAAFGTVGAYLVGLIIVTVVLMIIVKRGQG